MEILFIITIIIIISLKKGGTGVVEIEQLPVKTNPKGFYDDTAFTDMHYALQKKK